MAYMVNKVVVGQIFIQVLKFSNKSTN